MPMKGSKTVDEYIESAEHWQDELRRLRAILRATELEEGVKWGGPCYTLAGANVVGIGAFKSYFGLWFFQGALLDDPAQVLINAQEGKTKALRQWRFAAKKDIDRGLIDAYVAEAIEIERQGRKIKPVRGAAVVVPPELEAALAKSKPARVAFEAMTVGKQREYAEYVAEAKRADTKIKRLDKILPLIRAGRGLNDKYRSS